MNNQGVNCHFGSMTLVCHFKPSLSHNLFCHCQRLTNIEPRLSPSPGWGVAKDGESEIYEDDDRTLLSYTLTTPWGFTFYIHMNNFFMMKLFVNGLFVLTWVALNSFSSCLSLPSSGVSSQVYSGTGLCWNLFLLIFLVLNFFTQNFTGTCIFYRNHQLSYLISFLPTTWRADYCS